MKQMRFIEEMNDYRIFSISLNLLYIELITFKQS